MKLVDTGKRRWGRKVWLVEESFNFFYRCGPLDISIYIHRGFESDGASIPWPLHYILHADGPWLSAAVLHDRLCESDVPRHTADSMFRLWLEMRCNGWKLPFYYAVRWYWIFIGQWTRKVRTWMRKIFVAT